MSHLQKGKPLGGPGAPAEGCRGARKKAGPEGRARAPRGPQDHSRAGGRGVAFMGAGREHRLSAAEAGHSVRQVVLVSLFSGDENSAVFQLFQN